MCVLLKLIVCVCVFFFIKKMAMSIIKNLFLIRLSFAMDLIFVKVARFGKDHGSEGREISNEYYRLLQGCSATLETATRANCISKNCHRYARQCSSQRCLGSWRIRRRSDQSMQARRRYQSAAGLRQKPAAESVSCRLRECMQDCLHHTVELMRKFWRCFLHMGRRQKC